PPDHRRDPGPLHAGLRRRLRAFIGGGPRPRRPGDPARRRYDRGTPVRWEQIRRGRLGPSLSLSWRSADPHSARAAPLPGGSRSMNFNHLIPTQIVFGRGRLKELGPRAAAIGRSALIVCGRSSARTSGLLKKVETALVSEGMGVEIFDDISPNPKSDEVD